ncbi:selenocysteine lyase/cysteine desulfurase [Pararhizobium capsulatum DSM 1112]|uniref:Selenocysteine lyase/cysteine desulfurase n=1 Tax=Pararhizobium capsulatum DSM 1112 TaxID=1121113 RepID=A0ABU0BY77_9HYPH|nr:aminotransferase class V-fold PLP-dependent enzyme [Pararhizobium capsulatum]MDQ0323221.1 selenocysteine lyase/cysteine desulfurase [Pararhizobium capsulatum DSM 1112]
MDETTVLDIDAVRSDFPYLRQRVYLNTAATGIMPLGAGEAVGRRLDSMFSRGYDAAEEWQSITASVKARLAGLTGVEAQDISFASSTSEVLNLVAWSVPVRPGDQVVVCEDEFPTVRAVANSLSGRGATLVTVAVDAEANRTAALAASIKRGGVVLVSHVHWETGTQVDLQTLSETCRAKGALLVVDGIHALGAVPVSAQLTDVYAASTFKWLLSGFGLAISITSPRFRQSLEPVFRGYSNPQPSRELQYSHSNYPGLTTLDFGLTYLERLGWDNIFRRNRSLCTRLSDGLSALGLPLVSPPGAAPIVSFHSEDAKRLVEAMDAEGVSVAARGANVRVSPHFYNAEADIDAFIDSLKNLERD